MNSQDVDRSSDVCRPASVCDLLARGWTTAVAADDLDELGRSALDAARHVFALPAEERATFVDPSGMGNIGWRPASRDDRPDEVWQIGGGESDLWPAELESDRKAVNRLRTRCAEIVADLLAMLAPTLELPPDELRRCVSQTDSVARLLHYTPRTEGMGFAPHTDFGLATFFAAESVPSLELEDETGRWRPIASHWAVAAGEMLSVRARGQIPAGRHRVRATARERWSVAVFVHPRPTYVLGADERGQPLTAQGFFERALAIHTGDAKPEVGEQP